MKIHDLLAGILMCQILVIYTVTGQEVGENRVFVDSSTSNENSVCFFSLTDPNLSSLPLSLWNSGFNLTSGDFIKMLQERNSIENPDYFSGDSWKNPIPLYPGLGNYQNFGGTLGKIYYNKVLALEFGAFINAKYGFLLSSSQITLGTNLLFKYNLTKRLQFLAWGQFLTPDNGIDRVIGRTTFFPGTTLGSGLQYNSTENTKIKVGVEYQYNQAEKAWKAESGGKVSFHF
ncbi:MAG: hypothetical protein AB2L20_11255 [Mangrovibacterium sp.]